MRRFFLIFSTNFWIALQEMRVNKLRAFLSVLGVSIGIFCIVSIFTVLDSLERNIKNSMASLGEDVLYISKWPWMDEGGEYKWWEFMNRPSVSLREQELVQRKSQTAQYTILMNSNSVSLKQGAYDISGILSYGVTPHFERVQDFEVESGRYFHQMEIENGKNLVVIGSEVLKHLFPTGDFQNKTISIKGKKMTVIGVLKEAGDNIAGFNFDRSVIIPFKTASTLFDVTGKDANNDLVVRAKPGIPVEEMKLEVEGLLRSERRLAPGEKNSFSINQLSQVTERISSVFQMIDLVGIVIAFFSLLVGGFGIANILFVSVKERTKIIGLKKAVGAPYSSILGEFLIEAVLLCLFGGLGGIFVVLLLSVVLTYGFHFPVTLSIQNFFIGVSISTVVGLLSGYIPARAAARLDPVVAIRSN